jgi:hypothetical protein
MAVSNRARCTADLTSFCDELIRAFCVVEAEVRVPAGLNAAQVVPFCSANSVDRPAGQGSARRSAVAQDDGALVEPDVAAPAPGCEPRATTVPQREGRRYCVGQAR